MRFTRTTTEPVHKDAVPLLDAHVARLREAHARFSNIYPGQWATWPGDDTVWETIRKELDVAKNGDWRIRVVLHPKTGIEVQVVAAPLGLSPFCFEPEMDKPEKRRPLIFDSERYDATSENSMEKLRRLYKTTGRRIYDEAGLRGAEMYPDIDHPEVLLHTATHLLESVTSNIAIHHPTSNADEAQWVTPVLQTDDKPFLDGVMRRYLIAKGLVREGEVTVNDWDEAKRERRRVIGFNGLRGVWEAEPL